MLQNNHEKPLQELWSDLAAGHLAHCTDSEGGHCLRVKAILQMASENIHITVEQVHAEGSGGSTRGGRGVEWRKGRRGVMKS
jgi:hypothetical protein